MTNQAKTTTTRYFSKYRELKIVRNGTYTKEVDGRIVTVPGNSIRFANNVYETSDPEEIKFLESRPEFGETFIKVPVKVETGEFIKDQLEDLEQREARLKAKEDELTKKEAKLNANEEGGSATPEEAELEISIKNSREELDEYATGVGVENPEKLANKGEVLEAIKNALDSSTEAAYE